METHTLYEPIYIAQKCTRTLNLAPSAFLATYCARDFLQNDIAYEFYLKALPCGKFHGTDLAV